MITETATTLVEFSAAQLRQMIAHRNISPVELLDACIAQIDKVNPYINAVTATCFERAREEAQQAEQAVMRGDDLGLLHGLPLGVKDLEATQGLLSTSGSPNYRNHIPAHDVELVRRLRQAGAIVAGKTNVPEMGAGANSRNPVWGATGNPFNPNLNAGGSSGGSAAALAADLLPVCTGSDTGGSLRIPASKCGVVGMRPSPGLVPSVRKLLGWTPLSVVGPMGRTVDDTCLQLAATAGLHAGDPLSYPVQVQQFISPVPFELGKLRVAFSTDLGCCDVDPDIRRSFSQKMHAMKHLFARCDAVDLQMGEVHRCFDVLRAEAFVAGTRDAYAQNPESLGPNTRANYELGAQMSLLDCAWAQAEQTRILQKFQHIYQEYDVLLTPTTPVSPFPWMQWHATHVDGKVQANYYHWLALTYAITLTTHPAITLPCGLDEQCMPFGLQVVGRFRGDLELLSVAKAMETAFAGIAALRRPRPDLSRLQAAQPDVRSIVTHPPQVAHYMKTDALQATAVNASVV